MPILTKDFLDSEFPEPDGKFPNPEPMPAEAVEPEADMSRDVVGPMGSAINSEEETIVFYKDLLDMFPDFAPVLKDIIAEEEKHIGQLEVLRNSASSEMTKNIKKGVEEAEHQLETGSSEEPDDLGEAEVEVADIAIEIPEDDTIETAFSGEISTEGDFKEYSDKADIEAAKAEIETDDKKSRYIDDILNEDASKKKWIYQGPIYDDYGMVVRDGYEWVHADDKQTAVEELIKRLKKAYKSNHIHIEPQFVKAEAEALIIEAYNPEVKPGDKLRIIDMVGEPHYAGRTGEVEHIDDMGQIHGTWGGCALIPEEDTYELIVDEALHETFESDLKRTVSKLSAAARSDDKFFQYKLDGTTITVSHDKGIDEADIKEITGRVSQRHANLNVESEKISDKSFIIKCTKKDAVTESFDLEDERDILLKAGNYKCKLTQQDIEEFIEPASIIEDMEDIYNILCGKYDDVNIKYWYYTDDGIRVYFCNAKSGHLDIDDSDLI
jgi:rubrerythrin